jgi:hypothetical protein
MTTLDPEQVKAAVASLSGARNLYFTRRCLMFQLCRQDAWSDPGAELDASEQAFAAALEQHERTHGQLERLIRPELAAPGIDMGALSAHDLPADLFDYAIRRVAVFERMDLCLMLIANGFHREIEIALTVPPSFPSHVWARVRAQLDAGLRTTFLAISDCGAEHEQWQARLAEELTHPRAELRPVGLTVPWAFRLHLPLRGATGPSGSMAGSSELDDSAMDNAPSPVLRSGGYALIEELPPLRAMRWIYRRVARGAEDVGFG